MGRKTLDPDHLADADPVDLTDRELMIALGTRSASTRRSHQRLCGASPVGVLPALKDAVASVSSRLSLRYVEHRESTTEKTAEKRHEEFDEYLMEATRRFDDSTGEYADWGFR